MWQSDCFRVLEKGTSYYQWQTHIIEGLYIRDTTVYSTSPPFLVRNGENIARMRVKLLTDASIQLCVEHGISKAGILEDFATQV